MEMEGRNLAGAKRKRLLRPSPAGDAIGTILYAMSKSTDVARTSLSELNAISLFDPENLQELAMLRQALPAPSDAALAARAEPEHVDRTDGNCSATDRVFEQFKVGDDRKDWEAGVLYIDIIHRGRIRIVASEWPPAVMYCKKDLTQSGIVKQFRLHILRNASNTTLIYGTYRFKQKIAKTWLKDYRCGKLLDATMNIREAMINLAYWLTAQPYAEKSFATWEELIGEATEKLEAAFLPLASEPPKRNC